MYVEDTGCCAVKEILHLADHNSAEEAMMAFCDQLSEVDDYYYDDERPDRSNLKIPGLITFTGVVNYRGHDKRKKKPVYGKRFKAFILRNGLGPVSESSAAINRLNHPDHIVKLWCWRPSATALRKWYKGQKGE